MSRLPSDVVLTVETLSYEHVAKTIDHSLLRPELTDAELTAGFKLAQAYHVASVCIKPSSVPLAARLLRGSDALVGTVVGFPHGSSTTRVKVCEARQLFFFQAEDGIRDWSVTGVQTCALPI